MSFTAMPRWSILRITGARLSQQRPRDDELLDFRGPFADRPELRVTKRALDRILLHVSVAAVDLDRLEGHLYGDLARVELRHRGFGLVFDPLVAQRRGALRQEPRAFDLHRHLGKLELDRLELGDRLVELLASLRVVERR